MMYFDLRPGEMYYMYNMDGFKTLIKFESANVRDDWERNYGQFSGSIMQIKTTNCYFTFSQIFLPPKVGELFVPGDRVVRIEQMRQYKFEPVDIATQAEVLLITGDKIREDYLYRR
jgi:hypothetical protein